MARDFPIGNGNLLINFDSGYNIRDMYFPHVGQENHGTDHLSHFGMWTEEGFFWIDDPTFVKKTAYLPDSLVTNINGTHHPFGVQMTIHDGVDVQQNVFLRKVIIRNNRDTERLFKLFFHLDLHLYGLAVGDTVYFDPDLRSLVFYKSRRYVSMSCQAEGQATFEPSGYACGQKEISGLEGTWRDAEDGNLSGNAISQGSIDGTIEREVKVAGQSEQVCWFWVCFGRTHEDIVKMEKLVRTESPQAWLQRTNDYWTAWVGKDRHDLSILPERIATAYKRSLLTIRTNMDNRGAIMAANDSDTLKFAKDTYSYMWPRDGALIAHVLDRSGYDSLTRTFFDFCKKGLSREGFIFHKYNPDSTVGSSWHPWINAKGEKQFAIQEDETALVLFALWHHHVLAGTQATSEQDYREFVIPMADFLAQYRDASGLPLPSYDLWEERFGVMAFTVATVYAGLCAASQFAEQNGDRMRAIYYKDTSTKVRDAALKQLYTEQEGRFLRALYWNAESEQYEPDLKLDASMYAIFDFGLVEATDPRMVRTMEAIHKRLWVQTNVGGMARYENDYYHQVSNDITKVPGNPWFICTMWYAEWLIAVAKTEEELKQAESMIEWAIEHSLPSGMMAEQLHPYTGDPISVTPLTWSHSTFVKVVQEFLSKKRSFEKQAKSDQDVSEDKILTEIK
jgi:GH15 family glucan-1,4-alpha-glucosidase